MSLKSSDGFGYGWLNIVCKVEGWNKIPKLNMLQLIIKNANFHDTVSNTNEIDFFPR